MNAIDTNVLIYRLDRHDPVKRAKAKDLLQDQGHYTFTAVHQYLNLYRRLFPIVMPTPQVLDRALHLANRYNLSHWDSMLLGACLEANVETLFTEDMGAPTVIEGVQLANPFV
jgi:predicted nucleic acid-binding protein